MATTPLPVVSDDIYRKFNACVHCGLCLPACPTYVETQDEADSPRGRIHLMKAAVDGRISAWDPVFEHVDRCLVCRACETACPSGVVYHELVEAVRPQLARGALGGERHMRSGVLQWVIKHVLPYPGRVRAAMAPLKVARHMGMGNGAQRIAAMTDDTLGAMALSAPPNDVMGDKGPVFPAFADRKHKRGVVVLLRGCVGSVVSADVNRACVRVLTENGFDVHVLEDEACCGAMAAHANDPEGARRFAKRAVDALASRSEDYFVSPIAGCGAQLKELDHVLAEEGAYGSKASQVVRKMRDITELLVEVGIRAPGGRIDRRVTYHDPCHLVHAQRISEPPRRLLAMIPGLAVVPLIESELCCGAAGTYNLNQPEMAQRLGRRKAARIQATGAQEVVTANVGCSLQIARHLAEMASESGATPLPVRHVVELLAESYDAE